MQKQEEVAALNKTTHTMNNNRTPAQKIIETCCFVLGCTVAEIKQNSRTLPLTDYRKIIVHELREAGYSFPETGKAMGGRHHTSIMYMKDKHDELSVYFPEYQVKALACEAAVQALIATQPEVKITKKIMAATEQLETYRQQKKSGRAATLRQQVADYLARANMATTKMVAAHIDRPLSTATARLDELASQGKITKAETPAGKTNWQWVVNPEEWPANIRRYDAQKVIRNIKRVVDSDAETNFLPSNLVNRLILEANEIERAVA